MEGLSGEIFMKFLIVNGVNLALTGKREPQVYGDQTLAEINEEIAAYAARGGHEIKFFQSDLEGELCQKIGTAEGYDGIILNPGAYAHYSYALRDAVSATKIPVIEVHMTNITAREEFRSRSVISPVCKGALFGFGKVGYLLALDSFLL